MKTTHAQKAFVIPLVSGIIALLIGGGVYVAWHKNNKLPYNPQLNWNMLDTEGTYHEQVTSEYDISELGIKFVLPASVPDLIHVVAHFPGDQAVNSVALSSKKLAILGCATGTLGYLTLDADKGGSFVASARGSNLYYIKPSFVCESNISAGAVQDLSSALRYLKTDYVSATTTGQTSLKIEKCSNGATNYPHCNTDLSFDWKIYLDQVFKLQISYPSNWIQTSDAFNDPRYNVQFYFRKNQSDRNEGTNSIVNIAGNENCSSVVTNGWQADATFKYVKRICYVEKRLLVTLIAPDEAIQATEDAMFKSIKFIN